MKKKINVGLSLRLEFIDDFLLQPNLVQNFEVIADNWLSIGPHHIKLEQIATHSQLYFHCVGMNIAGTDPINFNYLNKINELKNKFNPQHISDHLCFQKHNNKNHHDLLPFAYNTKNLKRVSERVLKIQDQLKTTIGIENLSSYIEFRDSEMAEIDFLNQLSSKTGCFQLLDLNNIWVNEKNLNINIKDYLEKVNFKYVKEVHLAGANPDEELIIDDHGAPINTEVLKIFENLLIKLNPGTAIFYERDAHLPTFKELLIEFKKIEGVIEK